MTELVVFVGGGAMRGIYSAGVLKALTELGIRKKVSAIYGISAGAFNAKHFALGSIADMLSWYTDAVPNNGVFQAHSPLALIRNVELVNMQMTKSLLAQRKLVDVDALVHCPTPVFFGMVHACTKQFEFKDARRPDALQRLLASATIYPFVSEPVLVEGEPYIDGGYAESVALARLRVLHPGAKFLIVLNADERSYSIKQALAKLLVQFKDKELAHLWSEANVRAQKEFLDAQTAHDVLLLSPPRNFPVHATTTDVPTIEKGLSMGYNDAMQRKTEILLFCR